MEKVLEGLELGGGGLEGGDRGESDEREMTFGMTDSDGDHGG